MTKKRRVQDRNKTSAGVRAGRPVSRFACDRAFLETVLRQAGGPGPDDVGAGLHLPSLAVAVGVSEPTLRNALGPQKLLGLETAAALGRRFGIPYIDFYPVGGDVHARLASADLGVPFEIIEQPRGAQWAARSIEGELKAAVCAGRPCVVVGPAGAGKASLAARLALALRDEFGRGIVWHDARAGLAIADVHRRVASALRFHRGDPPAAEESARAFGRFFWARPRFLIVDGCDTEARFDEIAGKAFPRDRAMTATLVLTDSDHVAAQLHVHRRFVRFELRPLEEEAVIAYLQRNTGDDPRLRSEPSSRAALTAVIAGRPATLRLALDRLLHSRAPLAELVRTFQVESLAPEARRVFQTLMAAFRDADFPAAWARHLVGDDAFEPLFSNLVRDQLIHEQGEGAFRVHPHFTSAAVTSVPPAVSREAKRRLAHKALIEAERLRVDGTTPSAWHDLRRWRSLWKVVLDTVCGRGGAGPETTDAVPSDLIIQAIEIVAALRDLLPRWGAPEVERWLRFALQAADQRGRQLRAAQIAFCLARWLILERADFPEAIPLFESGARAARDAGERASGDRRDAAITESACLVELCRAYFAVGSPDAAQIDIWRAATVMRDVGAPLLLALRLNSCAITDTRVALDWQGGAGRARWERAERAFAEAAVLLAGCAEETAERLAAVVALNLAIARWTLGNRSDASDVEDVLRRLLSPEGTRLFDTYLFMTAASLGLSISPPAGDPVTTSRAAWRAALRCSEEETGALNYRAGEILFYLNYRDHVSAGGLRFVAESWAVTDYAMDAPGVFSPAEAWFVLFSPQPLAAIFDDDLMDRLESFLAFRGRADHRAQHELTLYRSSTPRARAARRSTATRS